MFAVYAIYSDKYDKIYIRASANLQARIAAHNHPNNKGWTKRFQPWRLVYSESFPTKTQALAREKQLKQHCGKDFIRSIIPNP